MSRTITLIAPDDFNGKKVIAIKAIRFISGLALREAKGITDTPNVPQEVNLKGWASTNKQEYANQCKILRDCGFKISSSIGSIIYDLRDIATRAIDIGEDELANEVMKLIVARKLKGFEDDN